VSESKEAFVDVANAAQADPLPSWNDTETKRSIRAFVRSVTDQNGPDYVPPAARIAVFDNDGTLWSWITSEKHPQSGRLYTEKVYQPDGRTRIGAPIMRDVA
jgi:hypothetical protein